MTTKGLNNLSCDRISSHLTHYVFSSHHCLSLKIQIYCSQGDISSNLLWRFYWYRVFSPFFFQKQWKNLVVCTWQCILTFKLNSFHWAPWDIKMTINYQRQKKSSNFLAVKVSLRTSGGPWQKAWGWQQQIIRDVQYVFCLFLSQVIR